MSWEAILRWINNIELVRRPPERLGRRTKNIARAHPYLGSKKKISKDKPLHLGLPFTHVHIQKPRPNGRAKRWKGSIQLVNLLRTLSYFEGRHWVCNLNSLPSTKDQFLGLGHVLNSLRAIAVRFWLDHLLGSTSVWLGPVTPRKAGASRPATVAQGGTLIKIRYLGSNFFLTSFGWPTYLHNQVHSYIW